MDTKLQEFADDVKKELGDAMVGDVIHDTVARQIAFATTETDKGENVKSEHLDLFYRIKEKHGVEGYVMPFSVEGKLVYVLAY